MAGPQEDSSLPAEVSLPLRVIRAEELLLSLVSCDTTRAQNRGMCIQARERQTFV